jgi:hypothetical protein
MPHCVYGAEYILFLLAPIPRAREVVETALAHCDRRQGRTGLPPQRRAGEAPPANGRVGGILREARRQCCAHREPKIALTLAAGFSGRKLPERG